MATDKFLQKHFKCPICQDILDNPRGLPCQHAFCGVCLKDYILSTTESKSFKCPLCKQRVRVPFPQNDRRKWANQFKMDFNITNIMEDVKDGGDFCVLEREKAHCDEDVDAGSTVPAPRYSSARTSHRRSRGTHDVISSMNSLTTGPGHAQSSVQQQEVQSGHTRISPMGTEVVEVISLPSVKGDKSAEAYDLEILVQDHKRFLLVPDMENKKLLVLTLDQTSKVARIRDLNLQAKPWRICKIENDSVALTVSEPEGIWFFKVNEEGIKLERKVRTNKPYDGIATLPDKRLVATSKDNVDVLNLDGTVVNEFKICEEYVKFPDISYVAVTSAGNIVVSDCEGCNFASVTPGGKVAWRRKANPLGVACTSGGRIFIADSVEEKVYLYTQRKKFVCSVVEKSRDFWSPSGVAADDGFLYVICGNTRISIFKLIPQAPPEDHE